MPVISICLSPGFQRSLIIDALTLGEVNRIKSAQVDVSGKGINVTRVLQRLGVDSICLSQGGDNIDELAALAGHEGLNLRFIASSGRLRTCSSIIEASPSGGHRVTELVEPSAPVDSACVMAMSAAAQALLPSADALVIAGSMAPGFPLNYQAQLASLASDAGVPVLLDLHGPALRAAIITRPTVVKINLAEFVATFLADPFEGGEQSGMLAEPVICAQLIDAVCEVSRNHETRFVLTRGANSVLLVADGQLRVVTVPALAANQVINPIGSGDSFLAGMLAHLLTAGGTDWRNLSLATLEQAIDLATACAQSNARTTRPGFLEDSFSPLLDSKHHGAH